MSKLSGLLENLFLRSVALVAGGAVIAQGVTVAVTPLLTRIFTPEQFGVLAAFTSALTILLSAASLRYELAIPQARSRKHAVELVYLCFAILIVISVLVLGVVAVSWIVWAESEKNYIWLLPLGLIFAGAFQVANYWAIREKLFLDLSKANINRSVIQAVLQVCFGLVSGGALALIIGYVVSQALGAYRILVMAVQGSKVPSRTRLRVIAKKYIKFPLFSAPASVLNASAIHLTPFIIIYFFGAFEAGLFTLAQRAMGAPMAFLGSAIANVYLSEIPRLNERSPEKMLHFYIRSMKVLIAVGLPIVLAATFVLWWGVTLIFGREWSGVSTLVVVLVPFFLGQFVVAPLSQTLNVLGRQDIQLVWDFFRMIVPNSLFVSASLLGFNFEYALAIFSLSMLLLYVVNVLLTLKALRTAGSILPGACEKNI
ncbi:oligosaccharide flippase family protein [Pseudomonas mandelii]|uniref:oligosaccharide flippase family protein n=1 Tax=Pseudomonas mandelii TaxID=75612 RepID=UPI0012B3C970|nr:oligosaccharide flippase family protein [Pseudomonas mandelii]